MHHLPRQMTCHLPAQILATTMVTGKTRQCPFYPKNSNKQFQCKKPYQHLRNTYKSTHQRKELKTRFKNPKSNWVRFIFLDLDFFSSNIEALKHHHQTYLAIWSLFKQKNIYFGGKK